MAYDDSDNTSKTSTLDFNGLILGFSSAALHYIGHTAIEGKSVSETNLPLALQNLEIIELLRDKTKGNLTDEESQLVDEIIRDLRLKYNQAVGSADEAL